MSEQTPGQDAPQGGRETQPAPSTTSNRIEDLPEWAQTIIRETRSEAAARRKSLEALEAQLKSAEDARLAEQQEWKALAEKRAAELAELAPLAASVKEMQEALNATVKARIDRLPEDVRDLVPDFGDARKTLDWLNTNEHKLMRPLAPAMDAGVRGDSGAAVPALTDMEIKLARIAGLTPEQWAAQRKAGEELDAREDRPR